MPAEVDYPFPVIDFHLHFPLAEDNPLAGFYADYRQKYGDKKLAVVQEWARVYDARWRQAWGFPEPEEASADWRQTANRWLKEITDNHLEGLVFVTGGGNRRLGEITALAPELLTGFAHHSPESPGAAAELARAVREDGLKGYKVFAPLLSRPLADSSLAPLWQTAEDFSLPVLVHFGILGGGGGLASGINISPLALEPVAKAYPGIPFAVPHFGCGYLRELLQLCWSCANVHVDTSGNNEWMRWYPEELTLEGLLRRFYETVGPERIIFGSDSSWFPRGFARRYLQDQVRACYRLGMREQDLALIFGGNARRLLTGVKG